MRLQIQRYSCDYYPRTIFDRNFACFEQLVLIVSSPTSSTCERWHITRKRTICDTASPTPQQIDKQRRSDQCRNSAHRQFSRRNGCTRDCVSHYYKDGAANSGGWNSHSVIASERETHEMRHNQSHITNGTTGSDRTTDQETCGNKYNQPNPRDLNTQIERVTLTEHQQIQGTGIGRQYCRADNGNQNRDRK